MSLILVHNNLMWAEQVLEVQRTDIMVYLELYLYYVI